MGIRVISANWNGQKLNLKNYAENLPLVATLLLPNVSVILQRGIHYPFAWCDTAADGRIIKPFQHILLSYFPFYYHLHQIEETNRGTAPNGHYIHMQIVPFIVLHVHFSYWYSQQTFFFFIHRKHTVFHFWKFEDRSYVSGVIILFGIVRLQRMVSIQNSFWKSFGILELIEFRTKRQQELFEFHYRRTYRSSKEFATRYRHLMHIGNRCLCLCQRIVLHDFVARRSFGIVGSCRYFRWACIRHVCMDNSRCVFIVICK